MMNTTEQKMKKALIGLALATAGFSAHALHLNVYAVDLNVTICKTGGTKDLCQQMIDDVKSTMRTDESVKEQCEGREFESICIPILRDQKLSKEFISKITEAMKIGEIETKKEKAESAKLEREQKRLASLPGVKIGMTANDVRNKSNWGSPNKINRTITAFGTHEQWVYGGGNYLYFDNGILRTIQN
jgi:hypothetical protein